MALEEKPVRHAVSVVIQNDNGETLFVLRSPNASSFPSVWSLPSYYVDAGERFEDTIRRIGKNKLGVELEPGELINEGMSDRGYFTLFMHDFRAKIIDGDIKVNSEIYSEIRWSEPEKQLLSMNMMGDCCRLYKEYLKI